VLDRSVASSRGGSGRREPPKELDWSHAKYVPLPPSPRTWEVDSRREAHRAYKDPVLGPVLQAGDRGQHAKVAKLAAGLTPEQRQAKVGEVVAKSCRKLIIQRTKSEQFSAAANQSLKMFELVPDCVQDVDRRRFNRILDRMDKAGTKHSFERVPVDSSPVQPLFSLSERSGWVLRNERKLGKDERPDPAFKIAAVDHAGSWLLDRAKTSTARPDARAAIQRFDRHGNLIAERQLDHDAYRVGKGSAGCSIAIMDSDGGLHIYDTDGNLVVETNLAHDSRVVDHFRTIETDYWGEFKTQVRAVDVAPDSDRYLFTLVDEAWCCMSDGRALWGVVMPLNEGWERVVGRSEQFGVDREVNEALHLFDLVLPVAPDDIKRKWRVLARKHHPDLNPDDPRSVETMKEVNHAFEILTGVDPETLGFDLSLEESDTTHFVRSAPDAVIDVGGGLQIEITMSGGAPQDWVYAASFASADGGAYLATYSGKVILVSREGRARTVYDIGICPTEIVDIGRYTYFLTGTRLYVVEDGAKLAAFLDVYQKGRLIVSHEGFGLLTSKTLQWFTLAGAKVGAIETRDPIRAIYAADGGAVIQTRRHQVEVRGLAI